MSVLDQAWQAFIDGNILEAEQLVSMLKMDDSSSRSLKAYLALEKENYQQAMDLYEQNRMEALFVNNHADLHVALHQQAMVAREMGECEHALDLIAQEEKIIQQHFSDDALRLSVNAYEQGYLRMKLGRSSEGLAYMEQSLGWSLKTDDWIAQACAYRGLGEIYQVLGNIEESKASFEKSLLLFRQAGDEIGAEEVEKMLSKI
ncbi:hypothetical protein AB1I63_01930 [Streptococcus pneumoniae]